MSRNYIKGRNSYLKQKYCRKFTNRKLKFGKLIKYELEKYLRFIITNLIVK